MCTEALSGPLWCTAEREGESRLYQLSTLSFHLLLAPTPPRGGCWFSQLLGRLTFGTPYLVLRLGTPLASLSASTDDTQRRRRWSSELEAQVRALAKGETPEQQQLLQGEALPVDEDDDDDDFPLYQLDTGEKEKEEPIPL